MTGEYEHDRWERERDGAVRDEEIILIVIVKHKKSEQDKEKEMLSCGSALQENEIET